MERDNPDLPPTPTTNGSGAGSLRDRAIGIIAFATVLALLYFGRDVLIPFTVALMLSLLIAPLVRRLRRIGLSRVSSVLVAVLASAFVVTAAAVVLGTQVLHMAESLPQYERTIQQKLRDLDEQLKIRDLLVTVVSALSGEPKRLRRHRLSVLDDEDPGRILRQHREQLAGRWQGPVVVPRGSILLCLGLGSLADTLGAELLVRALRERGLDARHVSMEDLDAESRPPGADPAAIAIAYVVSAFPSAERELSAQTIGRVRQHLPNARVVSVFLPGISIEKELPPCVDNSDRAVSSFVEAAELCLETATLPDLATSK
jgi:AI-2E family transporter